MQGRHDVVIDGSKILLVDPTDTTKAVAGLKRILQGHSSEVYSVSWAPDGRTLASGSADSSVKVWDVARVVCVASVTLPDVDAMSPV